MTGALFQVIHKKGLFEPETVEQCNNTRCYECAYQKLDPKGDILRGSYTCEHREVLLEVQGL